MKRYSKKREAIYDCLKSTDTHPSADWIYYKLKPKFPDLSLATVYRNLNDLKESGKIVSAGTFGGQERFDGETKPHAHAFCVYCSKIMDIPLVPFENELKKSMEEESGCSVIGTNLQVIVICPDCLSEMKKNEK